MSHCGKLDAEEAKKISSIKKPISGNPVRIAEGRDIEREAFPYV
jgi:hypothetical protein